VKYHVIYAEIYAHAGGFSYESLVLSFANQYHLTLKAKEILIGFGPSSRNVQIR